MIVSWILKAAAGLLPGCSDEVRRNGASPVSVVKGRGVKTFSNRCAVLKLAALCAILLSSLCGLDAQAATTDGTASFTVTMSNPSGGYSGRVDAFWVTDANGKFIQNVRKDAGTRQQYLYQWAAARTTTAIDGFSGATISTWTPVTVT
ncbi:MAG TPA: hypothetical protein VEC99_05330, partial [Clostridia bacterium]|nr:hypothetical protein [Clostridia bacterium]